MILVDTALARRAAEGKPIRVALAGAGFIARAIAWRLSRTPGIELVAIAARRPSEAERAWSEAGVVAPATVSSAGELDRAVERREPVLAEDASIFGEAGTVDAVVEATSSVEAGAATVIGALGGGKHVILVNADLDSTLGPLLKTYADRAGVVVTGVGGEEHALAMSLYRYVETVGLRPVLAGNIKGFYDPYRNPETQREFAEQAGQRPEMVASFADGTKLSMETTILANATGFQVAKRGMVGLRCDHVREVLDMFPAEELLQQGLVDFTLGAEPGSGAFVVGYGDVTQWTAYMRHFKLGDGPLHLFYQSHHLPHLEAPLTVARAVIFGDATVTPLGGPACEVVACAKRDLRAGEVLDGIGGFTCYGAIDNVRVTRADDLLPIGLSGGCRLLVDVPRDQAIRRAEVDLPLGRLSDRLYEEQLALFGRREPG